jgi:hypothetical protein
VKDWKDLWDMTPEELVALMEKYASEELLAATRKRRCKEVLEAKLSGKTLSEAEKLLDRVDDRVLFDFNIVRGKKYGKH